MYTITPLKVGSLTYYRGAFCNNAELYKETEDFAILSFLIQGNGKKFLVDTGGGDPQWKTMKVHGPSKRPPEESPDQALLALGVDPKEIDTVILTHLHWDHCSNNHLFPNATFYVQRAEMHYALDPVPKFYSQYESFAIGMVPPWARQDTKWKFLDGEYQLAEGIRLIPVPGHTPGLMGVLVDTAKGPHFVAGDAVPLYDNIVNGRLIPHGIVAELPPYYKSIETMESLGAVIIPGHDFKVLEHRSFPD